MSMHLLRSHSAVVLSMVIFLMAGCGASGTSQSSIGTGAVAINLVWNATKAANKEIKAPSTVATIQVLISGPSMTTLQQNFAAASGSGTISNVPAGGGITVTIYALDASGDLLYKGNVGNVTVVAGQTTELVTVIMLSVPSVQSINVTPTFVNISTVGATKQFKANGVFANMSTVDLTSVVTWSSSNTSVATIVVNGLATAVANGGTTITATSGAVAGNTALWVGPAPALSTITVTPGITGMAIGDTQQFTATGTYADGSTKDLTASVTWSSSNTIATTIDANGLASATATGPVTIKATFGSLSGSLSLSVQASAFPVSLGGVAVAPRNTSLSLGSTQQLTVTVTLNSLQTRDVTSLAIWSSSDPAIATVSPGGAVTALAVGNATITATYATYGSSCSVLSGITESSLAGAATGMATDGANLYVANTNGHSIQKIDIATGAVTTLAGSPTWGNLDGIGTAARFYYPAGLVMNGGNLYVADNGNNSIRKIIISTGAVTTLAGSGTSGSTDGIGTAAQFLSPYSITTDGTTLFVTEGSKIRKVLLATGAVTTYQSTFDFIANNPAGTYLPGSIVSGNFGAIITDGTYLYVGVNTTVEGQTGLSYIHKINIATGIETSAGIGGNITGFAIDSNYIYYSTYSRYGYAGLFRFPISLQGAGTVIDNYGNNVARAGLTLYGDTLFSAESSHAGIYYSHIIEYKFQ